MIRKITAIMTAALLCAMFTYGQEIQDKTHNYRRHRILVYYGTGYASAMYGKIDNSFIHTDYSLSSAAELRYAFFFSQKWGVSLGAGLSNYAAKATLNMEGVIPHYNDPSFDPSGQRYYNLSYKTDNLTEQQRIWALETPLQFHYEHRSAGGKRGVFAGLGAKGYFPVISAQSVFPKDKGTLTVTGYDPFTDTWFDSPPHFGKQDIRTTPAKAKLNYSVDAIADLGGIFRLSAACDFYAGVYGSYGFMDVLPRAAGKKDFITPEPNQLFTVNSLLSSNILSEYNKYVQANRLDWDKADKHWRRWQAGIKIGIHF
jgi:hypothetical protein